jgi:hypothetical protein
MTGVVELETKLGRDESDCDRVEREKPGIANNDQQKEADAKHSEIGRDAKGVVPRLLPEQARVANAALQKGVVRMRRGVKWRRDGR